MIHLDRPNRHCECKDSSTPFESSNYQITTTSHVEYLMVVEPLSIFPEPKPQYQTLKLPSDIQKLKNEKKLVRRPSSAVLELKLGPNEDRVGMRLPKPPSAFGPKMAAIVEQLEDRDLAKLLLEEFHAARLYTGHASLGLETPKA